MSTKEDLDVIISALKANKEINVGKGEVSEEIGKDSVMDPAEVHSPSTRWKRQPSGKWKSSMRQNKVLKKKLFKAEEKKI